MELDVAFFELNFGYLYHPPLLEEHFEALCERHLSFDANAIPLEIPELLLLHLSSKSLLQPGVSGTHQTDQCVVARAVLVWVLGFQLAVVPYLFVQRLDLLLRNLVEPALLYVVLDKVFDEILETGEFYVA